MPTITCPALAHEYTVVFSEMIGVGFIKRVTPLAVRFPCISGARGVAANVIDREWNLLKMERIYAGPVATKMVNC